MASVPPGPAPTARNLTDALGTAFDRYCERAEKVAKSATGDDRAKVHAALTAQITALTTIAAQLTA